MANSLRLLAVLAAPVVGSAAAAQSLLSQHHEIVLASGMPAPGFPAGASFGTGAAFVQPILDGHGTLLFRGQVTTDAALGIDTTNDTAIFLGRTNDDLALVLREDDQAPGLPAGIRIRGTPLSGLPFRSFRISPFGETLALCCGLADPVTPSNTPLNADSALFHGAAGALQAIAREGDPVPTEPGAVWGELDLNGYGATVLNASGKVLFRNRLQNGIGGVTAANDAVHFFGTPGNLQTVLREGDAWLGVGATGEIVDRATTVAAGEYPAAALSLNEAGQILHDVHFVVPSGSATSTANDRALAIWTAGIDTIVVREGDQAPGMPAGAVFADSSPTEPFLTLPSNCFAKSGSFVFLAQFPTGPGGVTANDDQAMFEGSVGALNLVWREGDAAPAALGAGIVWGELRGVQRNDGGRLTFTAFLGGAVTAADDSVLVTGTPGNYTVLAREGDPAIGIPGHTYAEVNPAVITMTERGHVLFAQTVTDGTSKIAWFAWTPEHGLRLAEGPADTWTTGLGTTTVAANLGSAGSFPSGDTCAVSMNNQGDFCGLLFFQGADATTMGRALVRGHVGSFVASPSAVPASGGVVQRFFLDAGPSQGNRLYLVLATALGTRPGFASPLGPQNVPLNFDPLWTTLSIEAANSPLWINTVGFTDANGIGIGGAGFEMPVGFPAFVGTPVHHAALLIDGSLTSTFVTEPSALKLF